MRGQVRAHGLKLQGDGGSGGTEGLVREWSKGSGISRSARSHRWPCHTARHTPFYVPHCRNPFMNVDWRVTVVAAVACPFWGPVPHKPDIITLDTINRWLSLGKPTKLHAEILSSSSISFFKPHF